MSSYEAGIEVQWSAQVALNNSIERITPRLREPGTKKLRIAWDPSRHCRRAGRGRRLGLNQKHGRRTVGQRRWIRGEQAGNRASAYGVVGVRCRKRVRNADEANFDGNADRGFAS